MVCCMSLSTQSQLHTELVKFIFAMNNFLTQRFYRNVELELAYTFLLHLPFIELCLPPWSAFWQMGNQCFSCECCIFVRLERFQKTPNWTSERWKTTTHRNLFKDQKKNRTKKQQWMLSVIRLCIIFHLAWVQNDRCDV